MKGGKIALIFPAFVKEYTGSETEVIHSLGGKFSALLNRASEIVDGELAGFDVLKRPFLDDELRSQYIAYIYSCAVSGIADAYGINPSYIAGYSMGLYAALYHCHSIDFATGLNLICNAFRIIHKNTNGRPYGMGVIGGLERDDIEKLKDRFAPSIEVINKNSMRTYVISGPADEIRRFLEQAFREGALHTKELNVTSPYHSSFLDKAAAAFAEYLEHIEIRKPEYPLVSAIDQCIIRDVEGSKKELVANIHSKINWYKSMCFMLEEGTDTFIECGAGKTLYKVSKFIEGDFRVIPVNKLEKFLIAN